MLSFSTKFFFPTNGILWKECVRSFILAIVPSGFLVVIVNFFLLSFTTIDIDKYSAPNRTTEISISLVTIFLSPAIETFLLSFVLYMLRYTKLSKIHVAILSGFIFGLVHAFFGALWFFGTAWSFFIFSCAFLNWRDRSLTQAFCSACVPHILVNLTGMTLFFAYSYSFWK